MAHPVRRGEQKPHISANWRTFPSASSSRADKQDGELGVFAAPFAHEDSAFAVLGVRTRWPFFRLAAPLSAGSFIPARRIQDAEASRLAVPDWPPKNLAILSMECSSGASALFALSWGALTQLLPRSELPGG